MSEKVWRVYASREITVYTSSSVVDPLAAEECRSWAVSRWSEDPMPAGSVLIVREKPGIAGRHSVRIVFPTAMSDHPSKEAAEDFLKQEPQPAPRVVEAGSAEEAKLIEFARKVRQHARRG